MAISNQTKGIFFMMSAAFNFSLMSIMVALTADTIPLFEQLFFRNVIVAVIAFVAARKQKVPLLGQKGNLKVLLLRSTAGFIGIITSFYASGNANQSDVAILTRMSPFIVTVLAIIFLKEKISRYQIIALLVAFVGALVVTNPQMNSNLFALIVALLSAVFGGFAYTCISLLKGKEHPSTIVFFFSLFTTVATVPLMAFDFVIPSWQELLLLLLIGVFGGFGQLLITSAYTYAKASSVSIYNYSGILFSMLFGFVFLGQHVGITSVVGGVLVVIAGLIAYKDEHRSLMKS